jgi:hypothetical protein
MIYKRPQFDHSLHVLLLRKSGKKCGKSEQKIFEQRFANSKLYLILSRDFFLAKDEATGSLIARSTENTLIKADRINFSIPDNRF